MGGCSLDYFVTSCATEVFAMGIWVGTQKAPEGAFWIGITYCYVSSKSKLNNLTLVCEGHTV